jgi:hypothetical protein
MAFCVRIALAGWNPSNKIMTGAQNAGHLVQFFDADDELVRAVASFLAAGFDAGHTCVCVATAEHRKKIAGVLSGTGFNTELLAASYRYIPLDAEATLESFVGDHRPDRERFHRIVGLLVAQAASRGAPVRIYGEMVTLLAQRGLDQAVLDLEELWNELSRAQDFMLFCGYPRAAVRKQLLDRISAVHSDVVGAA